jgi:hypothetical protein
MWKPRGIFVVALLGLAQGSASAAYNWPSTCPCPCPPQAAAGGGQPGTADPGRSPLYPGAQNAATQDPGSDYSDLGQTQAGYLASNISVAGAGASGASGQGSAPGGGGFTPGMTVTTGTTALVSPGFLTAATTQSPIPVNRVFFNYSLYDQFQIATTTYTPVTVGGNGALVASTTRMAGFNLNQYTFGVEKTFFNGGASFYVSAPILNASDNISGQAINGFGDLTAGIKILLKTWETGSAFSMGVSVAAPTARAGQFQISYEGFNNSGGTPVPPVIAHINPTFIQPWLGGLWNGDRFFIQEYFGVLIPSNNEFVTSINNNTSFGWRMYQGGYGRIRSITPMLSAQVLVPLANGGNSNLVNGGNPFPISFPTQLFLTEGAQVMVGERLALFGGVMEPVVGPTAFTVGATFGANLFF